MDGQHWLADGFEAHRPRLRAVAYRMLGSTTEADDAVQEAWLRLGRSNASEINDLEAWLVTVVGRVALNMLRSRRSRREESLEEYVPDPIVDRADSIDPENEALLADSVGLALLIVLETLTPAERLAFVLHDMFAIPFDDIARMIDRSPAAARQLASRARRRVRGADPIPDASLPTQWKVVDAFISAAREGDFDALVAILDPKVVLRADGGRTELSQHLQGANAVASQALLWSRVDLTMRRALINGAAGIVTYLQGRPFSIAAVTVKNRKIAEIYFLADPQRVARLDLGILEC